MTTLNYEIHENLADLHALLEKMKDFAVAQGWTATHFQKDKAWVNQGGGTYGWDPGSETFLVLTSTGFGSQDLQYRFRSQATGSVATHEWLDSYGYTGSTALDTTSSTHPVLQTSPGNRWSAAGTSSFPSQTIPKTWFFGNSKFILVCCEVDPNFCKTMAFGSVDLFDTAETEGNVFYHQALSGPTNATFQWFNHNTLVVFDTANADFILWDGDKSNSSVSWVHTAANGHNNGNFVSYGRAVNRNNSFTPRRPIYKQDYFCLDSADSRWVHLGKSWVFRADTEGLEIGQRVKYGTEEFLFFPNGRVNERFKGFAVQIAG